MSKLSKEEQDAIDFAKAVKNMQDNTATMIEFARTKAKVTRAKYLALVAEGFSNDEAIALCRD